MNRGIGFYGVFQMLFGAGSIFYSLGSASYYFLKSPAVQEQGLLTEQVKNLLSDPALLLFQVPYMGYMQLSVGIIGCLFGLCIFLMGYRINKCTGEISGHVTEIQVQAFRGLFRIFILGMLLFSVVYLTRGLLLQFGGGF